MNLDIDYELLATEILSALRGKRSQLAVSRRLGYRSNVVRTWQAGRRWPTASRFLFACRRLGVEPNQAVQRFFARPAAWLDDADLATPEAVAKLLEDLRGGTSILDVARRSGRSRFAVSRWLSGKAEPRLPDFLRMVDALSLRLLDFLTGFVDPARLPSVAKTWRELETARRIAAQMPWSHAVLRALELEEYRQLQKHEPGFVAKRVGISLQDEAESLRLLARTKQIHKRRGLWVSNAARTIDTRNTPRAGQHLLEWCARAGLERSTAAGSSLFSYNLFTVSERDLEQLKQLHLAYFRQLRAIVAQSEPAERVVIANVQLFALDEK